MEIGSFTLRDWALFLGAYILWCPVALLIWRFVRKRFGSPIGRAIVFGVLFAPGVVPIVREAYVVGPAILALGYFGVFAALGSKGSLDLAQQILKWSLGPIVAFISAYVVVIRLRQLR
jgi:hypothetical protein